MVTISIESWIGKSLASVDEFELKTLHWDTILQTVHGITLVQNWSNGRSLDQIHLVRAIVSENPKDLQKKIDGFPAEAFRQDSSVAGWSMVLWKKLLLPESSEPQQQNLALKQPAGLSNYHWVIQNTAAAKLIIQKAIAANGGPINTRDLNKVICQNLGVRVESKKSYVFMSRVWTAWADKHVVLDHPADNVCMVQAVLD